MKEFKTTLLVPVRVYF